MKDLYKYIIEDEEYFKTYEEICEQYKGTKYENDNESIEFDFVSQFYKYCMFTFESYQRLLCEAVMYSNDLSIMFKKLYEKFPKAELSLHSAQLKDNSFMGKLFKKSMKCNHFITVSYPKKYGNILTNEVFVSLLNMFNCFTTNVEESDKKIIFRIEQRYCEKVTDDIYDNCKYVYHITSKRSAEKIKKYGLVAKESRKQGIYHPKRIYVTKETNKDVLKYFAKTLFPNDDYVVLQISIKQLKAVYRGNKIEFYIDPMYGTDHNGLYTLGPILPSCIEEIDVDKL